MDTISNYVNSAIHENDFLVISIANEIQDKNDYQVD